MRVVLNPWSLNLEWMNLNNFYICTSLLLFTMSLISASSGMGKYLSGWNCLGYMGSNLTWVIILGLNISLFIYFDSKGQNNKQKQRSITDDLPSFISIVHFFFLRFFNLALTNLYFIFLLNFILYIYFTLLSLKKYSLSTSLPIYTSRLINSFILSCFIKGDPLR